MIGVKKNYADLERVRYYQDYRTKWFTNPVSGHRWSENTPILRFVVVGPFGECCTTRCKEKAIQEVEGWQQFYDKHGQGLLDAMREAGSY